MDSDIETQPFLDITSSIQNTDTGIANDGAFDDDLTVDYSDPEAVKRNNERNAIKQIEEAHEKSVAFAVRTNISYDGSKDDDLPIHGAGVSFHVGDYLHIVGKHSADWWIGRLVKDGMGMAFIPSPVRLERLRQASSAVLSRLRGKTETEEDKGGKTDATEQSTKTQTNRSARLNKLVPGIDELDGHKQRLEKEETQKIAASLGSPTIGGAKRKKGASGGIFKKGESSPPYEVVPAMRPIILIGPSLKGYDVTDMMQKAVFDYLKHKFHGRIIITRVTADLAMSKRSLLTSINAPKSGGPLRSGGPGALSALRKNQNQSSMAEVQAEIERIFDLSREMQLLVLDCDTINHPSQVLKTSLSPILIYIKINNPKVLHRLVKSRGKSQFRHVNVQMVAAEKLAQCPADTWNAILDENNLEDACQHLSEVLETYWKSTHPPPSHVKQHAISRGTARKLESEGGDSGGGSSTHSPKMGIASAMKSLGGVSKGVSVLTGAPIVGGIPISPLAIDTPPTGSPQLPFKEIHSNNNNMVPFNRDDNENKQTTIVNMNVNDDTVIIANNAVQDDNIRDTTKPGPPLKDEILDSPDLISTAI